MLSIIGGKDGWELIYVVYFSKSLLDIVNLDGGYLESGMGYI